MESPPLPDGWIKCTVCTAVMHADHPSKEIEPGAWVCYHCLRRITRRFAGMFGFVPIK
jgi:hypothetical protein